MLVTVSLALATVLPIRVAGAPDARAIQVLLQASGVDPLVAPCNDAGRPPDAGPDGVWSCGPVEPAAGSYAVYVLADGVLLDGGVVEGVGSAPVAGMWLGIEGDRLTVTTAGSGPAGVAGAPRGGGRTLLLRVANYPAGGAPMIVVGGASASMQVACRDDGQFPDLAMNDRQPSCAGPLPDGEVSLALQGNTGERLDLGRVDGKGPLVYATVDYLTRAVDGAPFTLPLPAAPAATRVASVTTSAAEAPAPTTLPAAATAPPAVAEGPGWGVLPWVAVAVAAGAGFGVGRWRGRRLRVPPELRRVRPNPLFEGGPTVLDGPLVLRAERLEATVRALVDRLLTTHRVVLVLPRGLGPPAAGAGALWVADTPDRRVLQEGLRGIAADPGPALALVVVGVGTVVDLGGVTGDPLVELVERLPSGVFTALVAPGDSGAPRWPTWRVDAEQRCFRA